MSNSRFNWADLLAVGLFLCLLFFEFRLLIWTDDFIYGGLDIRRSIYLFRKVSYELLQQGHMPLWMPHIYCGMPLLGSFLATPFYPTDFFFAFAHIPLNMAFNWDLLVHLAIGQIFSYLFFRRLFENRMATIFCSMWFWNIFFLNSITIGDALNIRAMLLVPMVFYFLHAAFSSGGQGRHFVFLSCALSLQVLSGGVQFAFYTLTASAAYACFTLLSHPLPIRPRARLLFGFALAVVFALAVAGIQLLPQWEYSRMSLRSMRHDWFRVWALQPQQLLNYLFPSVDHIGYFGIAPIVLAPFSLIFWKDRQKYFYLPLGLVSILYALGENSPLSGFLGNFPLLRDFRGPFRAALFFNFSIYALAGGAITSLSTIDAQRKSKRETGFLILLIFVLVSGFVLSVGAADHLLEVNRRDFYFSAVMAALSISLVCLLLFSHRRKQNYAIILVSLLAFDLGFHYGKFYSPVRVFDLFHKDDVVRFLEPSKDSRVLVLNTAEANYFGLFGVKSVNGHHPFPLVRHLEFLTLLRTNSSSKLASLAGVKYAVDFNPAGSAPLHPPVMSGSEVAIRPMPLDPLPLAFLANNFKLARGPADALSAIQTEFDPSATVILEENPGDLALSPVSNFHDRAQILKYEANRVVIDTESNENKLLVLTDTYYPGWEAKVDGKNVDVLRADYIFKAVPVPAGRHVIEFLFRPRSVFWGGAVSCFGIASLIGWAIASSRKADHVRVLE